MFHDLKTPHKPNIKNELYPGFSMYLANIYRFYLIVKFYGTFPIRNKTRTPVVITYIQHHNGWSQPM